MSVLAIGLTIGLTSGHMISAPAPIARPVTRLPPFAISSSSAIVALPRLRPPDLTNLTDAFQRSLPVARQTRLPVARRGLLRLVTNYERRGDHLDVADAHPAVPTPAAPANGTPGLFRPPCLGLRRDLYAEVARSPPLGGRARACSPVRSTPPSDHSLPVFTAAASSSASAPRGSRIEAPIRRNSASCSGFRGPLRNAPSSRSVT